MPPLRKSRVKFNDRTVSALDRYLISRVQWIGGIFGITNLAVLGGVFIYAFFVLPKNAAEAARNKVIEETRAGIANEIEELKKISFALMEEVSQLTGRAKLKMENFDNGINEIAGRTEGARDKAGKLDASVKSLELKFKAVTEAKMTHAVEVMHQLDGLSNGATIAESLTEIRKEIEALKKEKAGGPFSASSKVGFSGSGLPHGLLRLIHVTSVPPGAAIEVDGRPFATAPGAIFLDGTGLHEIKATLNGKAQLRELAPSNLTGPTELVFNFAEPQ